MAFENDPEGYRIAVGYAGRNFDKPQTVQINVLREYSGDWTLEDFQGLVADIASAIPAECRSSARVEMQDSDYGGPSSLLIHYVGPESPETAADRVTRCEEYVAERRASERATYERLKAKFG